MPGVNPFPSMTAPYPGPHVRARLAGRSILAPIVLSAAFTLFARATSAQSTDGPDVIAVFSSVSPDYARTTLPDGKLKPEPFAFAEGGRLGSPMADLSVDKLRLADVARLVAPALAEQSYVSASDPKQTRLLIVVYWGSTARGSLLPENQLAEGHGLAAVRASPAYAPNGANDGHGSGDPEMSAVAYQGAIRQLEREANEDAIDSGLAAEDAANQKHDQLDRQDASLLGYLPTLASAHGSAGTAQARRRQDLIDELDAGRYFVVLLAYDFQRLLMHKQRKILWETRFSIREHGHEFDRDLAAMAKNASRYFGRDSNGLKRDQYDAHVIIGPLKVLGTESPDSR